MSRLARPLRRAARGFTLVEVLATLMLMAIVLPAVMQGVSLATGTATVARFRTEAAGLAESKLAEIVTCGQWQNGTLSGDFGADWPAYRWDAAVQPWPQDQTTVGIQQIDLHVRWQFRGREDSTTLSTLVFPRNQQQ